MVQCTMYNTYFSTLNWESSWFNLFKNILLAQANARDCIDPCGVRVKFYNGTNSKSTLKCVDIPTV